MSLKSDTVCEDVSTFMAISRRILLRMRNVLDKSCRENLNTHFISKNFFRKSRRLWECGKMWWSQRGHRWRHNIVHTSFMQDKQDYMHTRACIRLLTRANARMRARARTHTHTHAQMCNIYCFSTATMIRDFASVLRYTYIVCLVESCTYSPGMPCDQGPPVPVIDPSIYHSVPSKTALCVLSHAEKGTWIVWSWGNQ